MSSDLMAYMHAKGNLDLVLLLLNGVVCTLIAWRLADPVTTTGTPVRLLVRVGRYLLAFAAAVVAIRIWTGQYSTPVDPGELLVNVVVLLHVWKVRGDLSVWADAYANAIARRGQR